MKIFFVLFFFIGLLLHSNGQVNRSKYVLSLGLEYRQLPIDIESSPRNGSTSGNGVFYGLDFWRALNLKLGLGIDLKKNWRVSLINYIRYNHLHWLELPEDGVAEFQNLDEKKNFKYDVFIDLEKKKRLSIKKEHYLFISVGVGLANLNTRYNVYFKDTLPSGAIYEERFQGTFLRFTPRINLGFQFHNITASLNAIVIEGPDLADLTSLWIGANISYELRLNRKRN